jgi:hypothetical protein
MRFGSLASFNGFSFSSFHCLEVSDGYFHFCVPDSASPFGVITLLNSSLQNASPVFKVVANRFNLEVGSDDRFESSSLNSFSFSMMLHGRLELAKSSDFGSSGSFRYTLGVLVSFSGSYMGLDSSLKSFSELVHNFLGPSGVVMGFEVGKSLVLSLGSESHVLSNEFHSSGLSSFECNFVGKER